MNRKYLYFISLIFIILSFNAFATELTFSPSTTDLSVGNTINLEARIENVQNMRSYQIYIKFDPEYLQVEDLTAHDFLNGGFQIWDQNMGYNNNTGVAFVKAFIQGSGNVSGSDKFATIQFRSMCIGNTNISYADTTVLVNRYSQIIPYTANSGNFNNTAGLGPVISNFSSFSFAEDTTDSLLLDDFVSDVNDPDTDIIWTAEGGTNINVVITSDRKAIFTSNTENWFGTEQIIFKAIDPTNYKDIDTVSVTVTPVNDPPEINSPIPDIYIDENGDNSDQSSLYLYGKVQDVDNTQNQISWSAQVLGANPEVISVTIQGFYKRLLVSANSNWYGEKQVELTATDPGGASDTDTITIFVNDKPEIFGLTTIEIYEDLLSDTLDLDNYVSDTDHDASELTWDVQVQSGNIMAGIDSFSHILSLQSGQDWNGTAEILLQVTDPFNSDWDDFQIFTVEVLPVNDPPVLDLPTTIEFNEDHLCTLDLKEYVSDPDSGDVHSWIFFGLDELESIEISNGIALITPAPDWFGQDCVNFTVEDSAGETSTDSTCFNVLPVNDPPVVSEIPPIEILEDDSITINLSQYVTDIDPGDEIFWSYTATNLTVIINDTLATIKGNQDWNGQEILTFIATDTSNASDFDTLMVTVIPVNDPPVWNFPDTVSFDEDNTHILNLNNYVIDPDENDSFIWQVSGIDELESVVIDENGLATITPKENWFGQDFLHFTVWDSSGETDSDSLCINVLPVNDPPSLADLPELTVGFGDILTHQVAADDPDPQDILSYALTFDVPTDSSFIYINSNTGLLTFSPAEGDTGMHYFAVWVDDGNGESDSCYASVEVESYKIYDIVKDRKIDMLDVKEIIKSWGTLKYDVNEDGKLDILDIEIVISHWGEVY